jgi:hypothetical protein
MATVTGLFSMDVLKKKWKIVRVAFGHLYNALNEAGSNWDPANQDDPKYGQTWSYYGKRRIN